MKRVNSTNDVTRRGFLAACGAGAAILVAPARAVGEGGHLAGLRDWYRAEVERFAEELRPRFTRGELRAMRSSDYDDDNSSAWRCEDTPMERLRLLAGERFGISVTVYGERYSGDQSFEGDTATAHLVMALSPSVDGIVHEAVHPCYEAQDAVAWDLITVARKRGMYVPTEDEENLPDAEALS